MKSIYNLLKDKIRQQPKIQNSILATANTWKRSHFIILSELIREELSQKIELQSEKRFELGTSISHITLQRFFESDYHFKTHNDLRFIKTLDKICIFLGYKDLNGYIESVKTQNLQEEEISGKEFVNDIIYRYCSTNFHFFKNLPDLRYHLFDELVFLDSPFIERIKVYSTSLSEKKLKLYTGNNRSNYEIFDLEIISQDANTIVVKTQEFWNLVFLAENTKEEYLINELNTQIYFLKKINDHWRIWDNYNPNSGILNDEIKKKP